MASSKQIKANQLNAQKSTGPKTDEGKATVAKNATKHGLLAEKTVFPWEDDSQFLELSENLKKELNPEGQLEMVLFERIVSLTWRLRRAANIESGIFAWRKYSLKLDNAIIEANSYVRVVPHFDPESIFPTNTVITDPERHKNALNEITENSLKANSELPSLGRTFVGNADTFSVLNRYETGIERSLFKALHELQRLQAARKGSSVPLPIAIDVHGDSET